MSYGYQVDACEFRIDAAHFEQIWKDAAAKDVYDANTAEYNKFNQPANLREFITHMFYEQGFDCMFDKAGNLVGIEQDGARLSDQDKFFELVSPYVDTGSYLTCRGEDGEMWRWRFADGVCHEDNVDIVYRTDSADCPLRTALGQKNVCTGCAFSLICLCDENPRLKSATCSTCGGEVVIDATTDQIIAGTTCTCQKRRFLVHEEKKE